MSNLPPLLVALNAVVLAVGGVIAGFAYRAFRRTGAPAMRLFAAGFGTVTLGPLFGGVGHQLFGISLAASLTLQNGFIAAGFGVLAYSLYREYPTERATVDRYRAN